MTAKNLAYVCCKRFPETGKQLYSALKIIESNHLCVATSWDDHSVSISRGCEMRGTIFTLSPDFNDIYLPNKEIIPLKELTHETIISYLSLIPVNHNEDNCIPDRRYGIVHSLI